MIFHIAEAIYHCFSVFILFLSCFLSIDRVSYLLPKRKTVPKSINSPVYFHYSISDSKNQYSKYKLITEIIHKKRKPAPCARPEGCARGGKKFNYLFKNYACNFRERTYTVPFHRGYFDLVCRACRKVFQCVGEVRGFVSRPCRIA